MKKPYSVNTADTYFIENNSPMNGKLTLFICML